MRARRAFGVDARVLEALVGVWCMAAPDVLGFVGPAATLHQVVGPLVVAAGLIAISESTRGFRHLSLVFGVVLVLGAPLAGGGAAALISGLLSGLVVASLSRVPGTLEHSLGGGWRAVWRSSARG